MTRDPGVEKDTITKIHSMRISDICPSQLYIAEGKYQYWQDRFAKDGYDDYEPVPIKKIGNDVFFTHGHSRALLLWQHGCQHIKVYHNPDHLDWIMYLVNLQLCKDRHITSIADLQPRVVSEAEYTAEWRQRCSEKQARIITDPLMDLVIQYEPSPKRKQTICDEILHALPDWFGMEEGIRDYIDHVGAMRFITMTLYGKVVGFCALKINYTMNADLYVLGIFEEFHGQGLGTRLIRFIQEYCRQQSIPYMTVKTLSERRPDPSYLKTRSFYESVGFKPFEEFPLLWSKENPCLYMLKAVDIS